MLWQVPVRYRVYAPLLTASMWRRLAALSSRGIARNGAFPPPV